MQATLTFLGTGTSMGVPTLGCQCPVCTDARLPGSPNRRTRPSILLTYSPKPDSPHNPDDPLISRPHNVLIDTGPDFHAQATRLNLRAVDAVLYTHGHADHILGMDDLRPFSFAHLDGLPLFADDPTAGVLERIFEYTFRKTDRYPSSARVALHRLPPPDPAHPPAPIPLFGASFQPVPVTHGPTAILGYRFGAAAYLTDLNDIPETSFPLLENLDLLILDALRRQPHPSHAHLDKSIQLVHRIRPKRALFTHISHDLDHLQTNANLPPHIQLAHDNQQLTFEIA